MGHETVLVSGTYREQVIKELIERSARRSEYGHGANGVREKNITFNSLDEEKIKACIWVSGKSYGYSMRKRS